MTLYKVCGNRIVADWELEVHVCPVLGVDISELIRLGIVNQVEPTVEECVRFGSSGLAEVLYENIYQCDAQTAFDAVQDIRKNLKE